jgi:hypothetical protein
LAETVQSHPPASGSEHASTDARDSIRKWYIERGLYKLTYMLRCGFDSFSVATERQAQTILDAVAEFAHWYQPALDEMATIPTLRRRAAANPVATGPSASGCAATWAY